MLQVAGVAREAVHAGIAVKSPRLPAAPRRIVGEALVGLFQVGPARNRVVGDYVPRTEVGTEVVFHRLVGVRDGHVAQRTVARTFGGPHQQFEVHHVVDDDRILPFVLVVVPRADQPHFGLEARRQRARPGEQHLLVGLVSREAQPVAETAIEHEPHVVVVGGVFLPLDARGVHPSVFQHPGIAAVLVDVPQHAREKAAAPPARIRRDVPAVLPRARQAAFARAVFFGHQQRLPLGAGQRLVHDGRQRFLPAAGAACEQEGQGHVCR